MSLYPQITCYPPLGQLAILPIGDRTTSFSVVLQWSKAVPIVPWEVSICYSASREASQTPISKWSDLPLGKSDVQPHALHVVETVDRHSVGEHVVAHNGSLTLQEGCIYLEFTVKYRMDIQSPWQFVERNAGIRNGTIIFQPEYQPPNDLQAVFELAPGWTVTLLEADASQRPEATVFDLQSTSSVPSAPNGNKEGKRVLGQPRNQERFLAFAKVNEPWIVPRHGKKFFEVSEQVITACFLNSFGQTITVLPMNGINDTVQLLQSNNECEIVVSARDDSVADVNYSLIIAVANSHEASVAAAMNAARNILGTLPEVTQSMMQVGDGFHSISTDIDSSLTTLEEWYDGIGYCTYNSLGLDLTTEKITQGLKSLAENGILVSTLIIDDNWQSIEKDDSVWQLHRAWEDMESSLPNGLKATIAQIRHGQPHIKDIAVWHALFGYWKGISPSGKIARDYRTVEVECVVMGHLKTPMHVIHPDEAQRFYDDFYTFLSSCGVTAVKTDVQCFLDGLTETSARSSLITTMQTVWNDAHARHFGGKAISCMSMIPQILFRSFLPKSGPLTVMRNSEDYLPELPSSHAWHVFINAHNTLFTQHLNVLPDWDMFQTSHSYAGFHAAARCLSGGPIYITDRPGEHDTDLIQQMVAPNLQGRSIALRPTYLGRSINAYNGFGDGALLKIGAITGQRHAKASMMGLFNISESAISFMVSLLEFPGLNLASQAEYLVCGHHGGDMFGPMSTETPTSSLLYGKLAIRGWSILCAYQVRKFTIRSEVTSLAVLGLLGKMTGAAAVVSCDVSAASSVLSVMAEVKALGSLGVWLSRSTQPVSVKVSHRNQSIAKEHITFTPASNGGLMMCIDLERGWSEVAASKNSNHHVDMQIDIEY